MMNFDAFEERICGDFQERYPEMAFRSETVKKVQDGSYHGLSVVKEGSAVGVILDLDAAFRYYLAGDSYEEVLRGTMERLENALRSVPFDVERAKDLSDYGKTKSLLWPQVVEYARNAEVLEGVPKRRIGDLALVVRIVLDNSASALVKEPMLENWHVTEDQMFEEAILNAGTPVIRNMAEVLGELTGSEMQDVGIWVASNTENRYGASVIAVPGFFEQAAGVLGKNFYLLPSSIHEVLLVPEDGADSETLLNMVKSINETEVSEDERLSDNVYHYDICEKVFETASEYERRTA